MDGDGFTDWISPGGTVSRNDRRGALTPLGRSINGLPGFLQDSVRNLLLEGAQHADPLVRWLAPYSGTVAISGPIARKESGGGDVLAEIWRDGQDAPRWSRVFAASDMNPCQPGAASGSCDGDLTQYVNAGDALYFRVQAMGDMEHTALLWDPRISYRTFCQIGTCTELGEADHAQREPWGAPVYDFSQAEDFRLAGPPHRMWTTSSFGTANVSLDDAVFTKRAPTADDVTVRVIHHDAHSGVDKDLFVQTFRAAEVASVDVGSALRAAQTAISVTASATTDATGAPSEILADGLRFEVFSDSPIDPNALSWSPKVRYDSYCRTPPQENATPVCGAVECSQVGDGSPCTMQNDPSPESPLVRALIVQAAPVTYSNYLVKGATDNLAVSENVPTRAWPAPETGTFQVTVTYALASSAATAGTDDTVFLVQGNQKLLAKFIIRAGTSGTQVLTGLAATAGEPLYFTALRKGSQEFTWSVEVRSETSGTNYGFPVFRQHRVSAWDDAGEFGMMSGGYHQWSTGQWTHTSGASPVISAAAIENRKQPTEGDAANRPFYATFPSPRGVAPNLSQLVPGSSLPAWTSSGLDFYISAGELKPSYVGSNPRALIDAAQAPAVRGSHGSSDSGSVDLTVGGFTKTGSESEGDVDLLDLNGDGYPDSFNTSSVSYGDGQGSFTPNQSRDFGGGFRKFKSNHIRYGFAAGTAAGAIAMNLGASGVVDTIAHLLPSFGRTYGRTRATLDLIDVNGDGLPDRVERSDLRADAQVRLNLGYGFGPAFPLAVPRFSSTIGGEGIPDFTPESGEEASLQLQTNIANSYQMGHAGIGGGLAYSSTRTLIDFADVTGDGLPDRVLKIPGRPQLYVQINTGEGFAPEQVWAMPDWGQELPSSGPLLGMGSRDVLAFSEGREWHLGAGGAGEIPVWLGICLAAEISAQFVHNSLRSELAFQDVDGDGFADHVLKTEGQGQVYVKLNEQGAQRYNLLASVTNPLGGRVFLDYQRVGNTVELPQSQWVLSRVTHDDGLDGAFHDTPRTTRFEYSGGLYHRDERQNYGFSQLITRRPDESVVVQSFRQDSACSRGVVWKTLEQDAEGKLSRKHQTVFEVRTSDTLDSCFAAATDEVTSLYDGVTKDENQPSLTLEEQRDYDQFGNVTFYSNAGDSGAEDDLSHTVDYDPVLVRSGIFRPTNVTAFDSRGVMLRERVATYHATGDLHTLHNIVTGGHQLDTGEPYQAQATPDWVFDYDAYGNTATVTDPTGFYVQNTAFDAETHTYPTTTQDAFGYSSSAVPFPQLGTNTSVTDIRGNTVKFYYGRDNLVVPRVLSVQAPTELAAGVDTVSVEYFLGGEGGPSRAIVRHFDSEHPTDPLETVTFVDGFGRTIQVKKETDVDDGSGGVTHGFTVSGLTLYDERGRVLEQGQPVFNAGPANDLVPVALSNPTRYEYDVLSRPTKVTQPNSAVVSTEYGFAPFDGKTRARTKLTDPNKYVRVTYEDVRGQTVGIEQVNTIDGSDKTLTTRY
ncbi:MAG TPA: toxin TcdB middle/N-terminal domain-containing protein, partial [Polyangiaceae bacterium]|nr:toxin TcdB middle/N-terminal domain-containing protein [Polyangiaceae bacterium]